MPESHYNYLFSLSSAMLLFLILYPFNHFESLMIEKLIFGNLLIPGETVRIVLALAGTAVATYFDLFNNKSIPNNVLYAFLAIAFLTNVMFFNQDLFLFGIGVAILVGAAGFVFYHIGQLGAADVFVLASIALCFHYTLNFRLCHSIFH